MSLSRTVWSPMVAVPGVVLAGFGLTHPHHLDAATAQWWMWLHIILLPVFPLLGAAQWVLLEPAPVVLRWAGRLAAFGYATCYGALDALAGIGAGAMAVDQGGRTPAAEPLFDVGNRLGTVGAWCFLAASAVLAVSVALRVRWRAVPGTAILLVAGYSFLDSHIYWPYGVLTMLGIAAGLALLAWVLPPYRPPYRPPAG